MDHAAKCIISAVMKLEVDFCFNVLWPVTGFCHFHVDILKLKQVTGHCLKDIQHSIIAISASLHVAYHQM